MKIEINRLGNNHFLPSSEPVFLLRGQDEMAAATALYWAALAESRGVNDKMVQSARDHAVAMTKWPVKKKPDPRPSVDVGSGFTFKGLSDELKPFEVSGTVTEIHSEDNVLNTVIISVEYGHCDQVTGMLNRRAACFTEEAWLQMVNKGMITISN